MGNSVDPDHTALSGAVWSSGSTLFAQTCQSENLESLRLVAIKPPRQPNDIQVKQALKGDIPMQAMSVRRLSEKKAIEYQTLLEMTLPIYIQTC